MVDTTGLASTLERSQQIGQQFVEKLFSATRPGAVFSEPVRSGDYTVITASEVTAAGGFGFGGGAGVGPDETGGRGAATDTAAGTGSQPPSSGGGAGAGGGGTSMARPVATIVIGPDGVKVRPIVDVTKIAIAGATAWGAVALMLMRMLRASRS